MMTYSTKGKELCVENKTICFTHSICEVKFTDAQLLVLLEIPPHSKEIDNIYAVGWIRWRIQNRSEFESRHSQTPYVGMTVVNGRLKVFDFCGIRYWVNLENGHIIERDSDGRYR